MPVKVCQIVTFYAGFNKCKRTFVLIDNKKLLNMVINTFNRVDNKYFKISIIHKALIEKRVMKRIPDLSTHKKMLGVSYTKQLAMHSFIACLDYIYCINEIFVS